MDGLEKFDKLLEENDGIIDIILPLEQYNELQQVIRNFAGETDSSYNYSYIKTSKGRINIYLKP